MPALLADRIERGDLVFGRKHRRADQASQILRFIEESLEGGEIGTDLIDRFGLLAPVRKARSHNARERLKLSDRLEPRQLPAEPALVEPSPLDSQALDFID